MSASPSRTPAEPVLAFDRVSAGAPTPEQTGLREAAFRLESGGLLLVRPEPGREALVLPDLAEGLLEPGAGEVRFLGRDWRRMSPDDQERLRGRIGRVFHHPGFVSNLTVVNNVILAQLHHTRRPPADILAEAETLARAAGLNGLPEGRPAWCPRRDLRRAEWVRAFLGRPALALLEWPEEGVSPEHLPLLAGLIRQALAAGTAVLAVTAAPALWSAPDWPAGTQRFSMKHEGLIPA
jgi:phospholipid/cholesterol/gamma-HCH transport system ATP-binding protein